MTRVLLITWPPVPAGRRALHICLHWLVSLLLVLSGVALSLFTSPPTPPPLTPGSPYDARPGIQRFRGTPTAPETHSPLSLSPSLSPSPSPPLPLSASPPPAPSLLRDLGMTERIEGSASRRLCESVSSARRLRRPMSRGSWASPHDAARSRVSLTPNPKTLQTTFGGCMRVARSRAASTGPRRRATGLASHGGVRLFHQKSTCLTYSTLGCNFGHVPHQHLWSTKPAWSVVWVRQGPSAAACGWHDQGVGFRV